MRTVNFGSIDLSCGSRWTACYRLLLYRAVHPYQHLDADQVYTFHQAG